MNNTYKTFWRRFFAGFIDGIALMIIGFATSMFTTPNGEVFTPLQAIVDNSVWLAYTIYLHGRYGQTLGKMICKVKVVTTLGDNITFLHALKRNIVYVILSVMTLATFFTHKEEYANYNESMAFIESFEVTEENYDNEEFNKHFEAISNLWGSPVMWIGYVSMVYFLLEVITMLTNKKRRAIHDFIAGTEVRRL
mgnify:CR=1 FL=1|tara:strand:- start:63 stop:644 length:582 start_codon:yes stop_codon:yes gene_type:complete